MCNLSLLVVSIQFVVYLVRIFNTSLARVNSQIIVSYLSVRKRKFYLRYNVNWPNENQIVCKIRQYFLNVSWAMGTWCLVGANIDRYLCSSRKQAYRRLSTSRMAGYFLFGNLTFFGILFTEVIYCFEASVSNVPVACYGRNIACRIFNDWAALSFNIILPSIFLAIFGILTIRNSRSRVIYPIITTISPNTDRNLTRILLIQVSVVLMLDLPFGVYRPYVSLTSNIPKSTYRVAVENLTYSIIVLLVCFTHSTSFYLYTLTGSVYRAAFRNVRCYFFNC